MGVVEVGFGGKFVSRKERLEGGNVDENFLRLGDIYLVGCLLEGDRFKI